MRKFAFILLLLAFSINTQAQTQLEIHTKILDAAAARDYQTAIGELKNLERADATVFKINNYDYLLARMQEKSGDYASAAANYQSIVNRNSILSEYALWHLAQIARASGNLILERTFLQRILALAPDSLLNGAAAARLARSYFESKNYALVIQMLNSPQIKTGDQKPQTSAQPTNTENTPKFREKQILLAEAYLQNGQVNEAREIFTKLVMNLANPAQPDDFALTAARILDQLDGGRENSNNTAPQVTETDHQRRAAIYHFNRDFPRARLHYQAIVERFPASTNVTNALYQIGRTHAQEGNFSQAIDWFERVQAEFPDELISRDALSQAASAYSRVSKTKEAVSRYEKFIAKYPDADNLERAYLNIVDILRDTGADFEALKWTAKTQETFRGKLPEAIALFSQARIHIAKSDWQNALVDLEKLLTFPDLGGTRVPGGTNTAEITFLRGFVLEQMQRYMEAIDVYLSIADGRGEYYGWRSTERLKALANNPNAKPFVVKKLGELGANIETRNAEAQRKAAQSILRLTESAETRAKMLEILKKSYAALPDYQKVPNFKLLELGRRDILKKEREIASNQNQHRLLADELLFLGLYDEAAPELETAERETGRKGDGEKTDEGQRTKDKIQNPKSEDLNYTLAVFYKRGDMANRAVAFIEPLWRKIPADYQIELIPRSQAELLYPAPYADALMRFAPEKNLDARFLLAIMRQESRYQADVKSYAAARGLMQFISTTSDKLAAELGKENFKQDELYHPPTAIQFGSQYLSNLFRQFPNQPQAVAASYNGGEDNMARWLARGRTNDADRYVPEIAFSQSKDYVYKVMANYRVYQVLYDEQLKAK